MPYIHKQKRIALDQEIDSFPEDSGELNYALTLVIKDYLETNGKSYKNINDIMGALEGAKMEFYRRVVVPYENAKIQENGDVY